MGVNIAGKSNDSDASYEPCIPDRWFIATTRIKLPPAKPGVT